MELLQITHNGALEISPYALNITEFRKVWEEDESPRKDYAVAHLTFVYFMCDYRSPYRGYTEDARVEKLRRDVIRDAKWKVPPSVTAAMEKYDELQITPSMGLLKDAQVAIMKIRQFFRDVDIKNDPKGTKIAILMKSVGSITDVIKGLSLLEQKVQQETDTVGRIKGGGAIGSRELPKGQRGTEYKSKP